jgi:hypothetical protein
MNKIISINLKITDDPLLSNWLTHGISLLLLILLNCSNSVLVRGVYIDAEEPEGQCVIFPVYYIRLFFQKERTKKQHRLSEKCSEPNDQNNTVLLIDKPQMNHSKSGEVKVKTKIINIAADDKIAINEFNICENNNEKRQNNEHKVILCEDE